jgi:hypothetical protein
LHRKSRRLSLPSSAVKCSRSAASARAPASSLRALRRVWMRRIGAIEERAGVREHHLVGAQLHHAHLGTRGRPPWSHGRHQRRLRIGLLQVFEDQGRIEQRDVAVDQHRHLALGIGGEHVRVLRLIAALLGEGHHHALESEALLAERDLHLAREQAQGPGIEFHVGRSVVLSRALYAGLLTISDNRPR